MLLVITTSYNFAVLYKIGNGFSKICENAKEENR